MVGNWIYILVVEVGLLIRNFLVEGVNNLVDVWD